MARKDASGTSAGHEQLDALVLYLDGPTRSPRWIHRAISMADVAF